MTDYTIKSPWIILKEGPACKGCGLEAKASMLPAYDLGSCGARFCQEAAEADVLLITGRLSNSDRDELVDIYDRMLEPKLVVAAGDCACQDEIDGILPVDYKIPGCAARPDAIIAGIMNAIRGDGGTDE